MANFVQFILEHPVIKTKTKLKQENRKRLKTKNLPTKRQQFKYNMPEMRLENTATRHRNHEACCTAVFSQIVKHLAS